MNTTSYFIVIDEKSVYERYRKNDNEIQDPSFPYGTRKVFEGSLQDCKSYMDIVTLGYTDIFKNKKG